MLEARLHSLGEVFSQGGWVTYVLTGVSLVLWAAVWVRLEALRSPTPTPDPGAGKSRLLREKNRALDQLALMRSTLKTLVVVAPLLGLLGTVAGMVEMFESLHGTSRLNSNESTVAGGISVALITTQLGLVIAAPGLVASRLLNRRELRRRREVEEVFGRVIDGRGNP